MSEIRSRTSTKEWDRGYAGINWNDGSKREAEPVKEFDFLRWSKEREFFPSNDERAAKVLSRAFFRERLAALCHEQWSGWMRYLFGKCERMGCNDNPHVYGETTETCIPCEYETRWERQMNTPYSELSPEEQESDRNEADKFLALINEFDVFHAEPAKYHTISMPESPIIPNGATVCHVFDDIYRVGEDLFFIHETGPVVKFQSGPITEDNPPNGCQVEDVIRIAIARLEQFQAGKYPNRYNVDALISLRVALNALNARTADRKER